MVIGFLSLIAIGFLFLQLSLQLRAGPVHGLYDFGVSFLWGWGRN